MNKAVLSAVVVAGWLAFSASGVLAAMARGTQSRSVLPATNPRDHGALSAKWRITLAPIRPTDLRPLDAPCSSATDSLPCAEPLALVSSIRDAEAGIPGP